MVLNTLEHVRQFTLFGQQRLQFFQLFLLVLVGRAEFVETLRDDLHLGIRLLQGGYLILQVFRVFAGTARHEIPEGCVNQNGAGAKNAQARIPRKVVDLSHLHDVFPNPSELVASSDVSGSRGSSWCWICSFRRLKRTVTALDRK